MPDHDDQASEPRRLPWTQVPRLDAAPIVVQRDPDGCGIACAVMLLRDRGIASSLEMVEQGLAGPSRPADIAERLQELSGMSWRGGSLAAELVVTLQLVDVLTQLHGTWAALLEPHGRVQIGHWVVIDGIARDGFVLVRDPRGTAYGLPLVEFAQLWGYTVLVIQQEPA